MKPIVLGVLGIVSCAAMYHFLAVSPSIAGLGALASLIYLIFSLIPSMR